MIRGVMRTLLVVVALGVALGVGCGQDVAIVIDSPAADATSLDAGIDVALDGGVDAPDAGPFVPAGAWAPATIALNAKGHIPGFGACMLAGTLVEYGERVIVDDCVECQCTTYGFRCRKRATCPDARCVFIDGQVLSPGAETVVATCFDCTCTDDGPACRRRTEAPCPTDGCKLGDREIPIGAQAFVSECHACTCDAAAGLLCENLCHPSCFCTEDSPACETVCNAVACPVNVPDQDRIELPCGIPVCDYGSLVGAPACE